MTKRSSETEEATTWRERTAERLLRFQFYLYLGVVLILLALTLLWPRIFITIPPGSRGVMYRYFGGGTVTDKVWPEGLHIIPPWDKLTLYEVRLQNEKLSFDVLSEEGLTLTIEVAVRYQPDARMLGYLHQDIGPEYFERLIQPEIESHVRRTFGGRPAHELYSSERDVLQELSQVSLIGRKSPSDETPNASEGQSYANVQELKLTRIQLPAIVETAIAEKYRQEQLMLEYAYKLEREEKEAERKRTEAAGIRDYNLIAGEVSQGLLRWRSIDATQALATSANAKVVVLGSGGQDGMQMLLNVDGPGDDAVTDAAASAMRPAGTPPPVPPATSAAAKLETKQGATEARTTDAKATDAKATDATAAKPDAGEGSTTTGTGAP